MSKQRALRRAEREREAAAMAAVRLEEQARRVRRESRRRRLTGWWPTVSRGWSSKGGPSGILAERRRGRIRILVAGLVLVQVLVWITRGDWPSRLAALVVTLLLLPLLIAFTA